jgi:hypothetical protein
VLLDELAHLRLVEVPHDDDRGVVRLIVGVVELLAVLGRDLVEVLDRADGRPGVRVLRVRQGAEAFDGLADGVVVDAQPLLLLDDLALRIDRPLEELEVTHALGLELHREADVRGRHGVVVGGDVLGREGVDLATDLLEEARVVLGRHVLRALEHHVLEHVGDAADADVLVLRAHVIEDLHGRDGRLVVGEEEHLEAVGEPPRLDVELGRDGRLGGGRLRERPRRGEREREAAGGEHPRAQPGRHSSQRQAWHERRHYATERAAASSCYAHAA